jgi:sialate O-acetylesterase
MAFPLSGAYGSADEISRSKDDSLRLCLFKPIVNTDENKWDSTTLNQVNRLDYFDIGWKSSEPSSSAGFSAIGYFFGRQLSKVLKLPVGVIEIAVGGAPAEAFIDRKTLEFDPVLVNLLNNWRHNDMIQEWCRTRADLNLRNSKNPLQRHPYEPAYIFEAGIMEASILPARGIIWYQGESNAHNIELHEIIFPQLVNSWRKAWNNPEMPFFFAQLSSINRPSWPSFRDSQRRLALTVPGTGMVATSDLGDSLNVHPVRKKEVGIRFSLLALDKVYSKKVISHGPEIDQAIILNGVVRLSFKGNPDLMTADGKVLREFEIVGTDHVVYPVYAEIDRKNILINFSITEPLEVRYGWKPYSRGNLVNRAGLPASTFKIFITKK